MRTCAAATGGRGETITTIRGIRPAKSLISIPIVKNPIGILIPISQQRQMRSQEIPMTSIICKAYSPPPAAAGGFSFSPATKQKEIVMPNRSWHNL
jgi:hypothetical protein